MSHKPQIPNKGFTSQWELLLDLAQINNLLLNYNLQSFGHENSPSQIGKPSCHLKTESDFFEGQYTTFVRWIFMGVPDQLSARWFYWAAVKSRVKSNKRVTPTSNDTTVGPTLKCTMGWCVCKDNYLYAYLLILSLFICFHNGLTKELGIDVFLLQHDCVSALGIF